MATYTHQRKLAERKAKKAARKADFNYMRGLQLKLEARPKGVPSLPDVPRTPRPIFHPLRPSKAAKSKQKEVK